MRCFVAVGCDPECVRALAAWQGELRRRVAGVAWVAPETFHLTLRFFGELAEARLPLAADAVRRAAAAAQPFEVRLSGAGRFARALWVGVDSPGLAALAATVEAELRRAGFGAAERPFRPHLTLGRLRDARTDVAAVVAAQATTVWGAWRVDELRLMRSQLDPQGAIHTPLLRAAIGGATVG